MNFLLKIIDLLEFTKKKWFKPLIIVIILFTLAIIFSQGSIFIPLSYDNF
jgi:hypothetical protein